MHASACGWGWQSAMHAYGRNPVPRNSQGVPQASFSYCNIPAASLARIVAAADCGLEELAGCLPYACMHAKVAAHFKQSSMHLAPLCSSSTHQPTVQVQTLQTPLFPCVCATPVSQCMQAIGSFLQSMGMTAKQLTNRPELVDLIVSYHFAPGGGWGQL